MSFEFNGTLIGESLYTVNAHPVTLELYLQRYEMVGVTEKGLYISIRDVPNENVMNHQKYIKQSQVYTGEPSFDAVFYLSVDDAIKQELNKVERKMKSIKSQLESTKRDREILLDELLKRGTQVYYVPTHAEGDLDHPDCQTGFITSVNSKNVFCRFWRSNGELRTKSDSEPCNLNDLVIKDSCSQEKVQQALDEWC